jgi:hypothetical protein
MMSVKPPRQLPSPACRRDPIPVHTSDYFQPDSKQKRFLRQSEQKLLSLRSGRDRVFSELKQRLTKRELIHDRPAMKTSVVFDLPGCPRAPLLPLMQPREHFSQIARSLRKPRLGSRVNCQARTRDARCSPNRMPQALIKYCSSLSLSSNSSGNGEISLCKYLASSR